MLTTCTPGVVTFSVAIYGPSMVSFVQIQAPSVFG
jgi:hypothetical protein